MVTHIIMPLPQANAILLDDYAKMFSHLPEKKFSVLVMSDFLKGKKKSKSEEDNREEFEEKLLEDAKKIRSEVEFIKSQASFDSLLSWSCFADLVSLPVINPKSLDQFNGVFPENVLGRMNCSLFISAYTFDAFDEIMIIGDYDQSIASALKSFLILFGEECKKKKVTLYTAAPEDEMSITFEQDLVWFLRKAFHDLGIVPIPSNEVGKQLAAFASKMEKPLLILGHRNQALLNSPELRKEITSKKLSIFYSN